MASGEMKKREVISLIPMLVFANLLFANSVLEVGFVGALELWMSAEMVLAQAKVAVFVASLLIVAQWIEGRPG